MSEASYTDRRNAASPEQTITLESGRVSVTEGQALKRAIDYADIVQVRLGIEMAGRDSQVVCRIAGRDGTRIVFGSRAWKSVGSWENRADAFRDFNSALHARLIDRADSIEFIEGQPVWFGYVMAGLGLMIALLGGGFAVYLAFEESPLFMGGIPGIVIGLYLAWMFRPRAPKPYDPALYAGDPQ